MKNKKGQIGNLEGIVIALVIIGILFGVGFLVLSALRTNLTTTTNTVTSESVTPTDTGVYLAYNSTTSGVNCFNNVVIINVTNQSGAATIITNGNYTVDTHSGKFRNISGNVLYNRAWNVTYTYTSGDDACEGVASTMRTTATIPAFLPIVVIISIVGILLAIIFGFLPKIANKETAYV